jgi:hypothetical protein
VESGRPYAYANAFEFGTEAVFIVNIQTCAVVGTYQSPGPQGCVPSDAEQFNSPHEGWLQRSPAGRMLDYVAYWDSGMRIVDVTGPAHPVEVGSFDYPGAPGSCCAHSTAPTPPGDYVYLEDEIGVGGTGGVHILDTHGCDGVHTCAHRARSASGTSTATRCSGSRERARQRLLPWRHPALLQLGRAQPRRQGREHGCSSRITRWASA